MSNTTSKKRFGLFRRGRSESPEVVPSAALKRGTSERKTQSYRISVYEVRSESPTPTCSSTEEGDEQRVDTRESAMVRRRRSPSPKRRQASPLKERRQQQRSPSPIKRNHVSNSSKTESWNEFAVVQQRGPSVSPRRGILKRATFSMADKNVPQKPQAIASFDLELARATSLTDEMSTDPEDNAPSTNGYPLQDRDNSFVIQPKRTVSFSKEVMDPKPKPSGVASLCLGTRSVRRVVSFSRQFLWWKIQIRKIEPMLNLFYNSSPSASPSRGFFVSERIRRFVLRLDVFLSLFC